MKKSVKILLISAMAVSATAALIGCGDTSEELTEAYNECK